MFDVNTYHIIYLMLRKLERHFNKTFKEINIEYIKLKEKEENNTITNEEKEKLNLCFDCISGIDFALDNIGDIELLLLDLSKLSELKEG